MAGGVVYHFSEEPGITRFVPRPARQLAGRPADENLVWAIDRRHSPLYYFPRDCPRIGLWVIEGSTDEDVDRWLNGYSEGMTLWVEERWAQRIRECELYRYEFLAEDFEDLQDFGGYVSQKTVEPARVFKVGGLEAALEADGARLHVVESLAPLADAWWSTLHFSGVRLRNAVGWAPPEPSR